MERVSFRNIASYVLARRVDVPTSRGVVVADISYGGALYTSVAAADVGLSVTPAHYPELLAIGREVKWALNETQWAKHPSDSRLDGIDGTILFDDLGDIADGPHQRNVTVFADGEVDRSPCGSGTSARLALLAEDGRIEPGGTLRHDSIVDTTFAGRVLKQVEAEGRAAVITEVAGNAYRTGTAVFVLDPRDPLGTRFAPLYGPLVRPAGDPRSGRRSGCRAVGGCGEVCERADERVGVGAVPGDDEVAGWHVGQWNGGEAVG